ncbi:TolC family protein [Synoicihabitans lomoniglobus]|uniref:TolC family protein n=1 Tax=Synoicihabitans lomoniglobus TaxID=2909285 RepID=A0AAE9ZVA9_9BACT|nr:TolC family protein [Opitutaceae bacterium LMO-M01]
MRAFTFILIGAAVATTPTLAAESPWTLTSALAEARAHSPEATMAAARIERAQAFIDQANAGRLPQLSLRAGYTQTNNPMMAFGSILNQGAFTNTIDFNAPGQVDNFNLTGTATYALYNGGRTNAAIAGARAAATASAHDQATAFARLDVAVLRAYFNIRSGREGLAALDAAVTALEASHRIATLRFEAGQLLKTELLNLDVQLAQTREQQLAGRQQVELAERQFLYLLGRRPTGPVTLAPTDPAITALSAPADAEPASRPELDAMAARLDAANENLDASRADARPSVRAFASYQLDHGWRLDGSGDSWMTGLQAEWNLFDGKATAGRIRAARAQLTEAEAATRQLELAVQLELEQTRLAHDLAVAQLEVTATLVAQAEEAATISRARFEAGSLLSAELIGVETRLTSTRVRRAVAAATERIAVAELRRAAGLPLLP